MGIFNWLFHKHYWGVPHNSEGNNKVVQICYECGKRREVLMGFGIIPIEAHLQTYVHRTYHTSARKPA